MYTAIIKKSGSGYSIRRLGEAGTPLPDIGIEFLTIEGAYQAADIDGYRVIPDGDVVEAELQEAFLAGRIR